jgi:hypothetical protein
MANEVHLIARYIGEAIGCGPKQRVELRHIPFASAKCGKLSTGYSGRVNSEYLAEGPADGYDDQVVVQVDEREW